MMNKYNYIAGVTAFIYTIRAFNMTNVSYIGLRYKKESDSAFTGGISIYENGTWNNNFDIDTYNSNHYMCSKFWPMNNDETVIRSLHCYVSNLEQNTIYNVEAFKVVSGVETIISQDTVTTKARGNCMSLGTITINSNIYGKRYKGYTINEEGDEGYNLLMSDAEKAFNWCIGITNDLGNKNVTISPKITGNLNGAAADSGYNFLYTYASDLSTIIHEMAHNYMNQHVTENKMYEFMEFATGYEGAAWSWQAKHCYPLISSASFSAVDNSLIVSAWFL